MKDKDKTKERLINELEEMRQRVTVLDKSEVEHKQAKRVLSVTEKDHQRLLELLPIGITILDMNGVITDCNPAVYMKNGYSRDDFIGRHFSKVSAVRPEDIPKFVKLFVSLVRGKIPEPFEVMYIRRDGTTGWTELHISLLKSKSEKTRLLGSLSALRLQRVCERL